MACVTSPTYTLMLNGHGSGFIRPTRGLRQGCALSPYLFILGMELLTRMLQFELDRGALYGVRLGTKCLPITNILYADDLILLGAANLNEALITRQLLCRFCSLSGQQIAPSKSRIWFSKSTSSHATQEVLNVFGVDMARPQETYLGSPIDYRHPSAFDPLLSKVDARLNMWKSKFLSQAGKLVLIRSVIEAILVYAMTSGPIHNSVINRIESKIRRFFWSDKKEGRYLAHVGWHVITLPKGYGGLGIRNLHSLNDALTLKNLWKLISGHNAPWVQVVLSKYLPQSSLWHSNRTYGCTRLWKAMMLKRDVIAPHIQWVIGDGSKCRVFAQPWFPLWQTVKPTNTFQRQVLIKDVVLDSGLWDVSSLSNLLGPTHTTSILHLYPQRPLAPGLSDKLMFTYASNGRFSLKKAYQLVSGPHSRSYISQPTLGKDFWERLWGACAVPPRVRLFCWKIANRAVPTANQLFSRSLIPSALCPVCNSHDEDVYHMLFECSYARQTWFLSSLGLKSDMLPRNIPETLAHVFDCLSGAQLSLFLVLAWEIWKSRCRFVFENTPIFVPGILSKAYTQIQDATYLRLLPVCEWDTSHAINHVPTFSIAGGIQCFTDGSYKFPDQGGVGYILVHDEILMEYGYSAEQVLSPLQAEARALLTAMRSCKEKGIINCTFHTDSKQLVFLMNTKDPPISVEWQAHRDIMLAIRLFTAEEGFQCIHVSRDSVNIAHQLANLGRIQGLSYKGFTFPIHLGM